MGDERADPAPSSPLVDGWGAQLAQWAVLAMDDDGTDVADRSAGVHRSERRVRDAVAILQRQAGRGER